MPATPKAEPVGGQHEHHEQEDEEHAIADQPSAVAASRRGRSVHGRPLAHPPGSRHQRPAREGLPLPLASAQGRRSITLSAPPGGTNQGKDTVALSAVIEDPQRYYGQTTTVSGAVGQVIEPRAFVMVDEQTLQGGPLSEVELTDGGVLVARTGGPAPNVTELQDVRVTGTLQQFDVTAFEQQQDVDLDDALYAEYQDRPVLVAAGVQPTQGEETAR